VSRQVTGYATVVEPDQPIVERDTITCGHCQRVIFVKPGTASTVYLIFDRTRWAWIEEPGAFCRTCMSAICLPCCDAGRCTPWEQRLEASESRDRLRRAAGV
jgi:hypothetical protein